MAGVGSLQDGKRPTLAVRRRVLRDTQLLFKAWRRVLLQFGNRDNVFHGCLR